MPPRPPRLSLPNRAVHLHRTYRQNGRVLRRAHVSRACLVAGQITPPPNPKLRAAARELEAKHDLRSPAQIEADAALELAREAAQKAPWWEKVTELDRQKAGVYRDAALARGIRPHGLLRSVPPRSYIQN